MELSDSIPQVRKLVRFSELSGPRQALVRLFQTVNYGYVQGLEVRDSDPVFNPAPRVFEDLRLDLEQAPRTEFGLSDFVLRDEICRLMDRLDELQSGMIERIDVCGGIPRRAVFQSRVVGVLTRP